MAAEVTPLHPPAVPVKLKSGDLVQLKSGSPMMVISQLRGRRAYAWWWDDDSQLCHGWIPVSVLMLKPHTARK